MADPVSFEGMTNTMKKEGCRDLPVLVMDGQFISCWVFDSEEQAEFFRTGKIWLSVQGGQPPVCLYARPPFTIGEEANQMRFYQQQAKIVSSIIGIMRSDVGAEDKVRAIHESIISAV